MANEIRINLQMDISSGSLKHSFRPGVINASLTGTAASGGIQVIGTAQELITLGADVATAGISYFQNLHTANYVDIAAGNTSSTNYFARLKAGEVAFTRLQNTNLSAIAQTSATTANVPLLWQVFAE
jgi:hypothetical protein